MMERVVERLSAKSQPVITTHRLTSRRHWMADTTCATCYDCGKEFSFWIRRHHCRVCGQIFCATCSSHRLPGGKYGFKEPYIRVCKFCHNKTGAKTISQLGSLAKPLENIDEFQPQSEIKPASFGYSEEEEDPEEPPTREEGEDDPPDDVDDQDSAPLVRKI
jgi:hypothetical protein